MRIYLSVAVLLLVFLSGCSYFSSKTPTVTPTGTTTTVTKVDAVLAQHIAGKYCPVLYLSADADLNENYEPDQVQLMFDVAVVRDSDNPGFSEKASTGVMSALGRNSYYIDVVDLNPISNPPSAYKTVYDSLKTKYKPTVYARVSEKDSSGYTVVQYWLFYYLNDWRNIHEGDWEMAQLNFPGKTVKEILEGNIPPLSMALSQHQSGQKMSWDAMRDKGLLQENHPRVYVARGSHANYFTPGQSWSVLDFDKTGVSTWRILNPGQIDVVLLDEAESPAAGLEWLGFKGEWGEDTGFSISVLDLQFWQSGPNGPPWNSSGGKSDKWGNPGKWAAALPDYPEPFWWSFLKLPGDWTKVAIFSVFSPADLHVYDAGGRHVGLNEKGQLETQIPGAIYITPKGTDYKTILIPDTDITQDFKIVTRGTGSGVMDIRALMPDAANKIKRFFEYEKVPVTRTTVAQARFMPLVAAAVRPPSTAEILSGTTRDTSNKLEIDSDGDGEFETESAPGIFEKNKVLRPVSSLKLDIQPDKIDITAPAEKTVTAYIELPAGYSPKEIKVDSILLFGKLKPLAQSARFVDHDRNNINELAVEFDMAGVVSYLKTGKPTLEGVPFDISFMVNDRLFTGQDMVAVFSGNLPR